MKTTNLDTSKKLKELGFEAETMAFIDPDSEEYQIWLNAPEGLIPAYDLETIWNTLPKILRLEAFPHSLEMKKGFTHNQYIGYGHFGHEESIIFTQEQNESLANTAGRLLVKLLEDNIIKLGE